MFDGLVSILAQEMRKKPMRPYLCHRESRIKIIDQMVTKILEMVQTNKLKPMKFSEIIEFMPMIKL